MKVLNDQQLLDALDHTDTSCKLVLENFELPPDPFSKNSPIQAASIDLTIGEIYSPTPESDGRYRSKPFYILKPGHTVHVLTRETVKMPPKLAGWGFPPTSLSRVAILMTNPGHVDPGFEGQLGFTLINMGKTEFHLAEGIPVCTLMICEIDKPTADYKTRYGKPSKRDIEKIMGLLSSDFMSFEAVAANAANKEIRKSELRKSFWPTVVTAAVALLVFGGGQYFQSRDFVSESQLTELATKVDNIEKNQDQIDLLKQFSDLEARLDELAANQQ